MQINKALKRAALALGAIGAVALLLTANGSQTPALDRAGVPIILAVLWAIELMALVLLDGSLGDAVLYAGAAVQLLLCLLIASVPLLSGSFDPVTRFVSSLPGGGVLTNSALLVAIGILALVIFAVGAAGLGLSISRNDPDILRDALAVSIIGLQLILPLVVAVVAFIVVQVNAGTQDANDQGPTLLAGAIAVAVVGIGAFAALTRGAYRAEKRDYLVAVASSVLGLTIIGAVFASGLLLYIGVAAAALGWLLALTAKGREMALGWVGLLIVLGASGLLTELTKPPIGSLSILALPLALSAIAAASSGSGLLSRGTAAGLGGLSAGLIIVAGTINNSIATSSTVAPPTPNAVPALLVVAAAFAAGAWVIAIVESARSGAWGWLLATIVLLSIGAVVFGLFGPTAEDVRQTQRQRQQRRAAGLA